MLVESPRVIRFRDLITSNFCAQSSDFFREFSYVILLINLIRYTRWNSYLYRFIPSSIIYIALIICKAYLHFIWQHILTKYVSKPCIDTTCCACKLIRSSFVVGWLGVTHWWEILHFMLISLWGNMGKFIPIILLLLCFFHDASGLMANSHRKSFMTFPIISRGFDVLKILYQKGFMVRSYFPFRSHI